jgi:hypothetical protein
MPTPWFRPKRSGYGFTPVTWQGWAVTLGAMLITMGGTAGVVLLEVTHAPLRRPMQAFLLLAAAAAIVGNILVARDRTGED